MIEELQRRCAAHRDSLSLGGGLPSPELFPRAAIARAFQRVVGDANGHALQYGWPEGNERLRLWVASRLCARGAAVTHDDVIITSGAQQAIAIAAEAILQPGDGIAVDDVSYPGALEVFRRVGARASADTFYPQAVYLQPGVANPTGLGIDESMRRHWLRQGIPIIADEAYAELRFDHARPKLLLAEASDRVWHVGSFSKTLCPGFRVGFLVPPRAHLSRAREIKRNADLECAGLTQAVLAQFLETDNFDARLSRTRRHYEARAHKLVRAIRRRFPSFRVKEPEGGFTVFVETDVAGDEVALLEKATQHGVSFDPGSVFRPDSAPTPVAMRLSFSSLPVLAIDDAMLRLQRAWNEWRREPLFLPEIRKAKVATESGERLIRRESYIQALKPQLEVADVTFENTGSRSDAAE